jgi:hypothetical protein
MAPSRQARSDFRARAVEAQIVGVMAVMMEFTQWLRSTALAALC